MIKESGRTYYIFRPCGTLSPILKSVVDHRKRHSHNYAAWLPAAVEVFCRDASAALFAAQRSFIAAASCARRAADTVRFGFSVGSLSGAFVLCPTSDLRSAAFFFFDERCFFLAGLVNFNRSLVSFFVSFSIFAARRLIFLFKFFRFINKALLFDGGCLVGEFAVKNRLGEEVPLSRLKQDSLVCASKGDSPKTTQIADGLSKSEVIAPLKACRPRGCLPPVFSSGQNRHDRK